MDTAGTARVVGEVMGTRAEVIVVGGASGLADTALARLHDLEARWSRFRPDSEISRCNRGVGAPCVVSDETAALVERLVSAWSATGGRFDPTQLPRIRALGYDRSWPFSGHSGSEGAAAAVAAPGCADIRVDRAARMVWLPPGTEIDPGGLGKGFAADLVTGELRAEGAAGGLVNVGGDLRVFGAAPTGDRWRIVVTDPDHPDAEPARIGIATGGLATSSTRRRRWTLASGGEAHHLIDPATGRPAVGPWCTVTAVAAAAWCAEAATKAALLDEAADPADLRAALGVRALLAFDRGGRPTVLADARGEIALAPTVVAS